MSKNNSSSLIVEASAPSNIALIKYMGKMEGHFNRPTNSSMSLTLDNLRTYVRITPLVAEADLWQPLQRNGLIPIELSEKGKKRFLQHFQMLKERLNINGNFLIESASNFPADCGLASSASSFAALTMASYDLSLAQGQKTLDRNEVAELSRRGSGSSIRSFFGPWCLWHSEGARPLEFPFSKIIHQVVVVESQKKAVSSSEAHQRVVTSLLFQGRTARAENRLSSLIQAFRNEDWQQAYQICWAEFWDMHALFETCDPHFGYMEPKTLTVLKILRDYWQQHEDGPIVTMDAGANIHLLYRENQSSVANTLTNTLKVFAEVQSFGEFE